MIGIAFVLLALAGAGFLARAVKGPALADRVVALDGLLVVVISLIMVDAARGEPVFLDVAVVIGLLGFVGTGVAARFIERQGS
ncbi:MAG: monovalent cation/H+ antiporter complex subunit F [Acidimicrobiales bacterium]